MTRTSLEVSTTDLVRHFDDYLARVRFGGQTVIILKDKRPVAELRGLPGVGCTLRDLIDICANSHCGHGFSDDIERVNAADEPLRDPWP